MAGEMPDLPDDLVYPAGRREELPDDLVRPGGQPEGSWLSRMWERGRIDPETTPRGFIPPEVRASPYYENIAKAFGHGFSQHWDADTFGLSGEAVDTLRKTGWITPEGTKSYRETGWKAPFYAFNELLFSAIWRTGQVGARTFTGVYGGLQEAGMEAGLHRDIVSIPDAFAGSPTFGIPHAQPQPWVRPTPIKPTVETGLLSRVDAAKTGAPHVDAVLDDPVTKSSIESPVVDRSHTVPNTAGGSIPLSDPTIYIDHRFPDTITARRASDPARSITFDPAEPFAIRANVEQYVTEQLIKGGMGRETANQVARFEYADRAEGAWYALHDIDQVHAEELYRPHMERIQQGATNNVPPNLYPRAELGGPRPKPDEIARAKAVLERSSEAGKTAALMRSAAGRDSISPIEMVEASLRQDRATRPQLLIRPNGERVAVQPAIMELDDLIASHDAQGNVNRLFPGQLQPRDRSAAASKTWVTETAAKLEPELLGESPTAAMGAPVVGPDRVVESGNGRVLLLKAAYDQHPDRAAAYRSFLEQRGYDTSGFQRPVLVRVRQGDMSMAERAAFAREANVSPTAGLSTRERAFADAKALDENMLAGFKGGDVISAGNREFVRDFAERVVPPEERPQFMDAQGKLSAEGARRIEAAMVARAWREPDIVAALYEAAEPTSKAILGAMGDTAPAVARLKAAVEEGSIPAHADPTPAIVDAFRLVERARSSGQKVLDVINQIDLERGVVPPEVATAARLFFRDDNMRQAAGRDVVAGRIEKVVGEALTKQNAVGDLFESQARAPSPKLPRTPSPGDYVGRIAAGSRTASGEAVSTKGKPGKAAKIVEGLTPQAAAKAANENLAAVVDELYMERNNMPRGAAGMDELVQTVAERVNDGIVKPGELHRTHETGHGQTAPADLPIARQQFAEELTQRLNDPKADPIETAAWIEWRLNIKDHPWTDGVGKTSRALAAIPLMRAGEPLPKYPTGRGFFKHATDTEPVNPRDGGAAYLSPQWQKFNDYYHDLVAESRRDMHAERAEVQALLDRNATPQEIEATPLIKRALDEGRSYPPTNEMEGYGSPEWRQNRRVILGDHEGVGWDAARDYLTDQARKAAGDGGVRNERRATIVIGPGGAGKSTIMEPLARKRGAAIIDADDAKKVLPEFRDGVGAGAVHEESSDLMYKRGSPLDRIMEDGGNLMIQKIGHNPESISNLTGKLKEAGYTVDLVHVAVDAELAFRRRVGRYLRTGRINPAGYRKMLAENGFKPRQTYLMLQKEGIFNETADIDVNGKSPRLIKADPALAADLGQPLEQPGPRRGIGQGDGGDVDVPREEAAAGAGAVGAGGTGSVDGRVAISAALEKFGERGDGWVHVPEGEIYLRATRRPGIGRTLEIPHASFEEHARGAGAFTGYLEHIEQEAARRGFDAVYAEQVVNDRLEAFLRKRGYVDEPEVIPGMGSFAGEATLYKPVTREAARPPAPRNPMLEASELGVVGPEKPSVAERTPGESRRAGDGGDPPPKGPEGPPPAGAPPPSGGEPAGSGWQKRWASFVGKLRTGEDVKNLIRDAAKENNDFPMARQGDIPLRDLQDVADAAGVDTATIDPRGLGRMLRNDAEVRVAVDVMLQATEEAKAAALEVKANPSTENLRKFQEAMLRRSMAVEQVVGHRAEWGRTGNVFQEFLQRIKDESAFQKFLAEEGIKTADLETLAKALADFDAAKAAKLLSEANKPTFWDKFMWYWVNSLISGPITHTKYIVANATFAAYEAAVVTPIAGTVGVARRALTGSREGVFVGETMARLWGIVAGVPDALVGAAKAAYTGLQTALPGEVAQNIIPKNARTLAFQQRPIGGTIGTLAGLPSRGASAIHSFFNFLGYRGSMEAQAYRAAAQRNMPHEQAFWAERQRLVDNPSEEMMNLAIDEGYRLTYINDVGPAAKKVGEAIRATKVGQLIMPFLHIPFNILARGVEGTPLGFLSPRVRADLRGANGAVAQDQAVARMIAGSAVGAWGVSMIANDRMTGFGPTEPKERAQWLATGHLPYSIRIGDYWYSFNRFGSIGTMLGIYANLGETIPHMKADSEELTKALAMTVHATGRLLEDEVGMQGLAGLMEAISEPERKGARFVSNFAGSLLPYSSFLRQTASALDPEMREVKSVVDGLRYYIPVVRQGLIPKRDWLGESVLNAGYGGDIPYAPVASAVIQHRMAIPDPLAVEMKLLDLHPAPPINKVGGIQLTPQLYEEYQVKSGALTRTMLEHFINQPGWDVMPKFVREELFRKGIAQAHQSAAALMQAEHPEIIQQGIDNKMRQLRGEKIEKKMAPQFANMPGGVQADPRETLSMSDSMREIGKRVDPAAWERMLEESPDSPNIEDRRTRPNRARPH